MSHPARVTITVTAADDFREGKALLRANGTPTAEQMRERPMFYNGWLWAIGFRHGSRNRPKRNDKVFYVAGYEAGKATWHTSP